MKKQKFQIGTLALVAGLLMAGLVVSAPWASASDGDENKFEVKREFKVERDDDDDDDNKLEIKREIRIEQDGDGDENKLEVKREVKVDRDFDGDGRLFLTSDRMNNFDNFRGFNFDDDERNFDRFDFRNLDEDDDDDDDDDNSGRGNDGDDD